MGMTSDDLTPGQAHDIGVWLADSLIHPDAWEDRLSTMGIAADDPLFICIMELHEAAARLRLMQKLGGGADMPGD
jgi:hypothetical protein